MAGRDRNEPDYLPPTPAEGLTPMAVTPEVSAIAQKMRKDAEKKLKKKYSTYAPLYYIKGGETDYCIRVEVGENEMIDVTGKYVAGNAMRVKAKTVTKEDQMTI